MGIASARSETFRTRDLNKDRGGAGTTDVKKVKRRVMGRNAWLPAIGYSLVSREIDRRFRQALRVSRLSENVLAFYVHELARRNLWKALGYSSAVHYARVVSGFGERKIYYLLHIGRKMEELGSIRKAFMDDRISWTKASEIVKIATPETERDWLGIGMDNSCRELKEIIEKVRKSTTVGDCRGAGGERSDHETSNPSENPGTANVCSAGRSNRESVGSHSATFCNRDSSRRPGAPLGHLLEEYRRDRKIALTFNFTAEEYQTVSQALRKWKEAYPDDRRRESFLLDVVKEFLERNDRRGIEKALPRDEVIEEKDRPTAEGGGEVEKEASSPRESRIYSSPYQVVIHLCESCRKGVIHTDRGEIGIDDQLIEKAMCDGRVVRIGRDGRAGENRKTVSDALRGKILLRDRNICQVPGCNHANFLAVHHIVRRNPKSGSGLKGRHTPDNLVSVCSRCHSLIHAGKIVVKGEYPHIRWYHGSGVSFGNE